MRRLILIVLLLIPALSLSWAQENQEAPEASTLDEVLWSLGTMQPFPQTAISPDGGNVAWVESRAGQGRHGTAIFVAKVNQPDQKSRIAAGDGLAYEDGVAWSPDGKQIAFLSDADFVGQQQLYTADADSGRIHKVTTLHGFLSSPEWSPDGKSIAFLFIANPTRAAGALQPVPQPSGVIGQHTDEQRINVADLNSGQVRAVSPAGLYVYEYDWKPDGGGFVATAAHGKGENNWWTAELYLIPAAEGSARSLYKPEFQIAQPRVSPDGRWVAFIRGLMSDQGVTGGDIWLAPLTAEGSAAARNLTAGMPASASWLTWTSPRQILFTELVSGSAAISTIGLSGGPARLWEGPEYIFADGSELSLSLARDGAHSALIRSSAAHPPEVWAGKIGHWMPMTEANADVKPLWGEQRSVHWTNDGFDLQGWLLEPRDYNPKKKYPLIVYAHGGPASACSAGWPNFAIAPLAASGYFVLCPNPRGSYGQGEAFTQANRKDFGGGDFRDIMAGVDEVLRRYPVNPSRLGIWGWSYGGYMTMWAETQTHRFRAAVAGAGVANWLSYYGENDIDQWLMPYFGNSVYEDPALYARSAPLTYVKNVKTPTLILVGERDGECPAPQSFEWWHALKNYAVPVELVVYPGEGHMLQQNQHRRDVVVRSVQWFDRWMPPGSP